MTKYLILLIMVLASNSAFAAFTYVQKAAADVGNVSGTSLSVTVSSTGSGNLLVALVGWEGANGSTVSVSDGTNGFTSTAVTNACSNDCHAQWFYLLSSSAGKTSITATWSSGRIYRYIYIYEYSYTGTASFDVLKSNSSTGSTAVTSGNFTTTGTDEVVFGSYSAYAADQISSLLINGSAPDQSMINPGFIGGWTWGATWAKVMTATFTGAASGTISGPTSQWISQAIAFKTGSGSSYRVRHRVIQD